MRSGENKVEKRKRKGEITVAAIKRGKGEVRPKTEQEGGGDRKHHGQKQTQRPLEECTIDCIFLGKGGKLFSAP